VSNAVIEIVRSHGKGRIISTLSELARDNIEKLERAGTDREVIKSGFPFITMRDEKMSLDYNLGGGFGTNELHVLGALESAGKSSMAVLMSYCASIIGKKNGYGVGYFSLEGGVDAVIRTLRTQLTGMPMSSAIFDSDKEATVKVLKEIEDHNLPFVVDDLKYERPVTTSKINNHIRMMKVEYGVKFVVIDYLTQIFHRAEYSTSDTEKILCDLVDIANEHGVAILLLHHLSNKYAEEVKMRNCPLTPELSHFGIAPSGLRRYANTILAISNPHSSGTVPINKIDNNGIDWGGRQGMPKRVELCCLKNKTGERGWSLPLTWMPSCVLFSEWEGITPISRYAQ